MRYFLYYKASGKKILIGIIYGIFTWVITTRVIVRLSYTPKAPITPSMQ